MKSQLKKENQLLLNIYLDTDKSKLHMQWSPDNPISQAAHPLDDYSGQDLFDPDLFLMEGGHRAFTSKYTLK